MKSSTLDYMDCIPQVSYAKISYEKDFRIAFLESKGDEFQRLFEKLMKKVYPNDFIPCRPWGKDGDCKNDGYLRSQRKLFQVYAPNEIKKEEAIRKINEDFVGAKNHWEEYFDKWVFVHNAQDGRLGPHIIQKLNKLRKENSDIEIEIWGYEELLAIFRQLSLQDLVSWFGPPLTMEADLHLGYQDLAAVLEHIAVMPGVAPSDVRDVSRRKIEANLLSDIVADFLKVGMRKAPLVEDFFEKYPNPVYGEQIAAAFKRKYEELKVRSPRLHPDLIFGEIEKWAGGTKDSSPTHKAAVLAIIAYLFDRCEIFEDAQAVKAV